MKPVKDLMHAPSYVHETDTVKAVDTFMNASCVEFMPVVNRDSEVVGTITRREIMQMNDTASDITQVAQVMKKELCSINADDDEAFALSLMRNYHASRLPVVDEKNHLKGVVSFMTLARRIIRFKQELKKDGQRREMRNFGGLPA